MSTAVQTLTNAGFTAEATICSILPREDGQDHTVILRTHGAYFIYHPHEGEQYKCSHVTWKKDYADVGEYDPAYTPKKLAAPGPLEMICLQQSAAIFFAQIDNNLPGAVSYL